MPHSKPQSATEALQANPAGGPQAIRERVLSSGAELEAALPDLPKYAISAGNEPHDALCPACGKQPVVRWNLYGKNSVCCGPECATAWRKRCRAEQKRLRRLAGKAG